MKRTQGSPRPPAGSKETDRPSRSRGHRDLLWILLPVLVAVLALYVSESRRRFLDQDEMEHLNAAYFITRGETIYGSFFENHPPLTALILQPVVRSSEDPEVLVRRGRWLMLGLSAGILLATGFMTRPWGGLSLSLLSALLLLSHPFFFQKGMEIRPDVPALLFLTLALLALLRTASGGRWYWPAAAGALLSIAGLFTPKVVYAAGGACLATAFAAWNRTPAARGRAAASTLIPIALGALIVGALAAAIMAHLGILREFWTDVFTVSLKMRVDDPGDTRWYYLKMMAALSTVTWGLAVLGTVTRLRKRRETGTRTLHVLIWSIAAGFVGLFLIRAPLRQYFTTFLPPLAVLAALGGLDVVRWVQAHRSRLVAGLATALLVVAATGPSMVYVLLRSSPIDSQINVLRKVVEVTGRDDRVFDCWTGLFLTRLPAYRYFYLNSDVQRLLPPEAMERDLLRALQDPRVKLVIVDWYVTHLPTATHLYTQDHFERIPGFPYLWLRK